MIELDEARARLLEAAPRLEALALPLDDAAGCVLAEPVHADRPIPPYDRSAMDGYAVRAADLSPGSDGLAGPLPCVGEIRAGDEWTEPLQPRTCVAIMTGAAVPPGADAVVEVEATATGGRRFASQGDGRIAFRRAPRPGENISPCGEDAFQGSILVSAGTALSPHVCGLLALCGHVRVSVHGLPRVALLSTGSEIVAPEETPSPHQIRDANSAIVAAMLKAHGSASITHLGRARDDRQQLRAALDLGLQADALILSGGVSRGTTDLVPDILEEMGVTCLFSGVAMKPGKPVWAGVAASGCMVLALPGNPLAVLAHASELAVPLLRAMAGHPQPVLSLLPVTLADEIRVKGARLEFYPVLVGEAAEGGFRARPIACHGSADLVGMAAANGFVLLPAGRKVWEKGSRAEARVWWG